MKDVEALIAKVAMLTEEVQSARTEAEKLRAELAEAKDEARTFFGMLDDINMIMYMDDRHALGQTDFDRQIMAVLERWAGHN